MTQQPRGLRNNNPTNLDYHPEIQWQGLATPPSDGRFCVFKTAQYGIRAAARNLMNYQSRDGCKTLRQIISRWAPPGENNTDAYILAVSAAVGVSPDAEISVDSVAVCLPVIRAVVVHENGFCPYPDSLIIEGLHLAGVSDASAPALSKQPSFIAKVGATAAAGAAAAGQYAPTVKGWADGLKDYASSPWIAHVVSALVTVAGGLMLLALVSDVLKHRSQA